MKNSPRSPLDGNTVVTAPGSVPYHQFGAGGLPGLTHRIFQVPLFSVSEDEKMRFFLFCCSHRAIIMAKCEI